MSSEKNLANFLFEVGTLRRIDRAHKQTLLTEDKSDNISSHTFRVTMIGWFLAMQENADPYKTAMMCLLHDTPETRSGDQNWVHKKYVQVFEEDIIKDQIAPLPFAEELSSFFNEYNKRESLEARVAKDADLIDQILLLKEYAYAGNKEAEKWLEGGQQEKKLTTDSAKNLVKEIMSTRPSEWWDNVWTADRK